MTDSCRMKAKVKKERQLARLYESTSEKGFCKVHSQGQKVMFYFYHCSLVGLFSSSTFLTLSSLGHTHAAFLKHATFYQEHHL